MRFTRTTMSVLAIVGLMCLATGPAWADTIIYVDAYATGPTHDGSSWCSAYLHLQDALAVALANDEIRVADGTYMPDGGRVPVGGVHVAGSGDRTATFQLINGVTVEGGYAGCGAPDPDARDVDAYETILSGDLNGDDAEVPDPADLLGEPTRAENSYHVVTGSGTSATAVLDGFTVMGGNADGSYPDCNSSAVCNVGVG